jgi:hypothetical protein
MDEQKNKQDATQENDRNAITDLEVSEAEQVRGGATLKFSPWIVRNKKGEGSKVDNPADMP